MSYVQLVLRDYANFSQFEGIALAQVLFDTKGNLMPSWRETYTEWLNTLANRLNLPDDEFRRCWIDDALENANPDMDDGDLKYIKENLFVNDVITDTCVRCGQDKSQGQYLEDERFLCDDCQEEIRKASTTAPLVQEQLVEEEEEELDIIAVPARVKPPRRRISDTTHALIRPNDFVYVEELLTADDFPIQLHKIKARVINKSGSTILIEYNGQNVRLTIKPENYGATTHVYSNKAKLLRATYWRPKAS